MQVFLNLNFKNIIILDFPKFKRFKKQRVQKDRSIERESLVPVRS